MAKTNPGEHARTSYLVRHWRGQLPLRVSFWLNYLLLSLVLIVATAAIAVALMRAFPGTVASGGRVAVWIVLVAVYVWQVVGAWRSASAGPNTHPERQWGTAARAALLIVGLSGGAVLIEQAGRHAAGWLALAPESAVLESGGEGGADTRRDADATLARVPLFRAVREHHAPAYGLMLDEMASEITSASLEGRPAEIPARVFDWARFAATERLARTSDDALLAFHDTVTEELEYLRRLDPVHCYDYYYYYFYDGDPGARPHVPRELLDREERLAEDVLRGYSHFRDVPSRMSVDLLIEPVFEALAASQGDWPAATGNGEPLGPEEKAKACDVTIDLRKQLTQVSESDGLDVIRYFYAQSATQSLCMYCVLLALHAQHAR
jgi:hypothetical protein